MLDLLKEKSIGVEDEEDRCRGEEEDVEVKKKKK